MSQAGPRVAWLFPGQGSQVVGMGQSLALREPAVAEVFRVADAALDMPLSEHIFHGPDELLQQTAIQQPAIVATSIAYWTALRDRAVLPDPAVVAGHSLGQYSALVAAGTLAFVDAVRLVAERGRLMQQYGHGGMAAVLNLDTEIVAEVAAAAGVEVANVNAPGQVTISGRADAVEAAMALAHARGARRVVRLPVSAAFHSSLMQPVVDHLRPAIEATPFCPPRAPVISNVDGRLLLTADDARQELLDHICAPVQWVTTMQQVLAQGVTQVIEIGPNRVLSGLARRVSRDLLISDAETILG